MKKFQRKSREQEQFELINPEFTIQENGTQSKFAETYLRKRMDFLERVFPDAINKEAIKHQVRLMRQESNRVLDIHDIMKSFQKKAVTEAANNVLQNGIVLARMNSSKSFAEKMMSLQLALNEMSSVFGEAIDQAFVDLPKIKTPYLRQRREQDLIKQIDNFHNQMEELIVNFQSITDGLIK